MKTPLTQKNIHVAALCDKAAAIVDSQPAAIMLTPPPSLGTNPLERAAASFFHRVKPDYLANYTALTSQRRFMFRCVFVPMFCKTAIAWFVKKEGAPRYWLWEHGTYLLAFERTVFEMNLRKAIKPEAAWLDALADPKLDYQYWMGRFDRWREAAALSYRYFIQKQSPQIKKSARPQAAHLGTIKNLCGDRLPSELFAGMLARINADAAAVDASNGRDSLEPTGG